MKSLQPNGLVLIFRDTRVKGGRKFDNWLAHAIAPAGVGTTQGASGKVWISFSAGAKDGNNYTYITSFAGDDDYLSGLQRSWEDFDSGGGYFGYVGEVWNFIQRPAVVEKLLTSDVPAWIASH